MLLTSRLLIRPLEDEHAPALCAYRLLTEWVRPQSWESYSIEDAVTLIARQRDAQLCEPGTWSQVAIVEQATGRLVSDCRLH